APMWGGIEPLWGFGTPIIGPDPQRVATDLAAVLAERSDWTTIFLSGMPLSPHRSVPSDETAPESAGRTAKPDPTVTLGIAFALSSLGQVGFAEGITRQIADIGDGYEQWLARRPSRFRRNLRQAGGKAEEAGVTIENASSDPALFDRLMAIENRSWKGREGSGITSVEMSAMYRMMIARLGDRGRLHAHVAGIEGRDVGYILGGVRGRRYRGLQISYVDEARKLSIGNLLQDHQLRLLGSENLADVYDLGMDFDYKRRWADRAETSLTIVVTRR
ncbi:MAG: GNAT family N-acetyltransferase, partial [Acidimicrobiales bacterium]